jgi:hypothetical protein
MKKRGRKPGIFYSVRLSEEDVLTLLRENVERIIECREFLKEEGDINSDYWDYCIDRSKKRIKTLVNSMGGM